MSLFGALSDAARDAIDRLCRRAEWLAADRVIAGEGEVLSRIHIVVEGWVCREKMVRPDARQILALLAPGDSCGWSLCDRRALDHTVRTLTRARIANIDREEMAALRASFPEIAAALGGDALVVDAVLRAWLANVGQRQGHERLAHLICELAVRMSNAGLSLPGGAFRLPLSQQALGDSLGMTRVYVSRSLQWLKDEKLAYLRDGVVFFDDLAGLKRLARFDAAYLSPPAIR